MSSDAFEEGLNLQRKLIIKHEERSYSIDQGSLKGFLNIPKKRKKCQVGLCNGNKTSEQCHMCGKSVCGKCTFHVIKRYICVRCK